jgi:polyphosphate kinase
MTTPPGLSHEELIQRISRDITDGYDEELEMEIEDRHPLPGEPASADAANDKEFRHQYFRQLFRLQSELVKLQDWVVASREKIVILFEGRDAAGKGSVIKRITLPPRERRKDYSRKRVPPEMHVPEVY